MNIAKLARDVARESKACRPERGGVAISIWREGDYSVATSRSTATDRRGNDGKMHPRLLCIDWPISAATARELIGVAMGRC